MSDQPENSETEPASVTDLAFRMGRTFGRLEATFDAFLAGLDRRTAETTEAIDARIAAEADAGEAKR